MVKSDKEDKNTLENLLDLTREMLGGTVKDVLNENVLSCDHSDLAAKAVRIVLEHSYTGVLVLKDGRPYKMVTAFDLLRLAYEEVFDPNRDFMRMQVRELVEEKEFIHVSSDTRIRDLLHIMLEKRVRIIPVIDGDKLMGICSTVDLMSWYQRTAFYKQSMELLPKENK